MCEVIAWYVVELRSRLAPHLPAAQVETIVTEARSHLNESTANLASSLQISQDEAAAAAIDAFGQPEAVAMTHLRQHAWRPLGIKPLWLVWGGASLSILLWVMEFEWMRGYFDNFGESWQNVFGGFCALAAVIAFGVGCYAGRQRHRMTILAVGAAVEVAIFFGFSFIIVGSTDNGQGLSRIHLSRDVENVRKDVSTLDRLDAYVREGAAAFAGAKSVGDIPFKFRDPSIAQREVGLYNLPLQLAGRLTVKGNYSFGGFGRPPLPYFIIPSESVIVMVDGRTYGLSAEADFSHAVLDWRKSAKALGAIAKQKQQMNILLESAAQARSGRLFFFNRRVYSGAILMVPLFLPVLVIAEAIASALFRRRRTWPGLVRA
jgi:hypothetical protein